MWLQRTPRGYVTHLTLSSIASRMTPSSRWRYMGQCRSCQTGDLSLVAFPPPERSSTAKPFTCMTLRQSLKQSSRNSRSIQQVTGTRTVLATPLLREGVAIGCHSDSPHGGPSILRQADRSCSKPLPTKPSSPLKTCACFKNLRHERASCAESVGELRALGEVGQAVSSTLDLETVLSAHCFATRCQLSGTGGGVIYEYDESSARVSPQGRAIRMEGEVVRGRFGATPIRPGPRGDWASGNGAGAS